MTSSLEDDSTDMLHDREFVTVTGGSKIPEKFAYVACEWTQSAAEQSGFCSRGHVESATGMRLKIPVIDS